MGPWGRGWTRLYKLCQTEALEHCSGPWLELHQNVRRRKLRFHHFVFTLYGHFDRSLRVEGALQLVLAKRDTVVVPDLSHMFIQRLRASGADPDVLELNCGHYSLALPPHILIAGLRLLGLLKGRASRHQNV